MLNNVHIGCFVGTMLVNHIMYADDLVLLSPSAAGLSMLPSICSTYGIEYDVMYNSSKSNVLVFRSKLFSGADIGAQKVTCGRKFGFLHKVRQV